jgi:hypothetical protein
MNGLINTIKVIYYLKLVGYLVLIIIPKYLHIRFNSLKMIDLVF